MDTTTVTPLARIDFMPSHSIRYEVLIASPGDVIKERDVVDEVIRDWNSSHSKATGINLQSLRWELDVVPQLGDRPQGLINKQIIDEADFVLALFSTRLGTPTGVAVSGTAEEIERLRSAGKHVMVYFHSGMVPRDHDPEQLRMLTKYKRELLAQGIAFDFKDGDELRRMLTRHLAAKMALITGVTPEATPTSKPELARLFVTAGQKGRSGDVKTVQVVIELENVSSTQWIRDYSVTISIPSPCLTFTSAMFFGEVRSGDPRRRRFRISGAAIHPGDKSRVFGTEIGIDQLTLKGTYLAGDVNAALADKVTVEAIVEGQRLTAEKSISEFFPNAIGEWVMKALEDKTLWKGQRPEIGSGDAAVRADELAEYLTMHVDDVNEALERLEQKGRVANMGGHLSDPTPRWHTTRRF